MRINVLFPVCAAAIIIVAGASIPSAYAVMSDVKMGNFLSSEAFSYELERNYAPKDGAAAYEEEYAPTAEYYASLLPARPELKKHGAAREKIRQEFFALKNKF